MSKEISYKSYCFTIGTTSYRTDNFNLNIELQLKLMSEFKEMTENKGVTWSGNNEFQKKYYNYLREKGFVKGEASRPDKDAREKTSGLVDIGLMDNERNITEAGQALLEISENRNFASDNKLEIANDSYIYLKQLLKTYNDVDGNIVRPFIVFLYVISKLDFLTYDEFTYLLPLCIDKTTTKDIINKILVSRQKGLNFDDIILAVIMNKENYQSALELLQKSEITEDLICTIGMNRKSKTYDKPYFAIYNTLKEVVLNKDEQAIFPLYEATKKLTNSKVGGAWRKYLFNTNARNVIKRERIETLNPIRLLNITNISEFNEEFFKLMHLIKVKATLSDYFDLNRRYFKITDVVVFEDRKVRLDILPRCYFGDAADELINEAFKASNKLEKNVPIEDIAKCLAVDDVRLYRNLSKVVGQNVSNSLLAKKVIRDERYERFNRLIDEKFNRSTLIELFTKFENRDDDGIRSIVTDNADIPTIFEYVLGIAWYIISGRQGDVLEYMNLSLEADLLPRTHAGGGEADIVWKYETTESYPKHTLLIEATLADGNNQRRMEMEPVSRHLGDYCISHPHEEAYCVFVTTYLHINVISDFRARKTISYYSVDGTKSISGMKILPLRTKELKRLLEFNITYSEIFAMFNKAYNSKEKPVDWYEVNIAEEVENYGDEYVK